MNVLSLFPSAIGRVFKSSVSFIARRAPFVDGKFEYRPCAETDPGTPLRYRAGGPGGPAEGLDGRVVRGAAPPPFAAAAAAAGAHVGTLHRQFCARCRVVVSSAVRFRRFVPGRLSKQ